MNVEIAEYLPQSIQTEVRKALNFIPKGRSLRLIRIPVFDFNEAISKICKKVGFVPFRPVLYGIPIDMTENVLPEMILVADDDTNLTRSNSKETEFYKPEREGELSISQP